MTDKVKRKTILWFAEISWMLGLLAFLPAMMTVIGYQTDREWLTRWTPPGTSPMALNTAIVLCLVSIGIMCVATAVIKEGVSEERQRP